MGKLNDYFAADGTPLQNCLWDLYDVLDSEAASTKVAAARLAMSVSTTASDVANQDANWQEPLCDDSNDGVRSQSSHARGSSESDMINLRHEPQSNEIGLLAEPIKDPPASPTHSSSIGGALSS